MNRSAGGVTKIERDRRRPTRFGPVVARLTSVNMLLILLAFVTSPILARALGPSGRGEVAAVFAVIGIAPWISELGITAFLSREHARRSHPLGELLGSTMPIAIGVSLIGVVVAVPLAHAVGQGREVVVKWVEVGLYLLPAMVFAQTLYGVVVGDQRWNVIVAVRAISAVGTTLVIVALRVIDNLTPESACATYVTFALIASLPLLLGLRGSRPWRFLLPIARTGLVFGVRSWLSTVAGAGNARLDQVLMAALVSSRQLGLYALAVTISTASGSLVGAATSALMPRVAAGEAILAARACRVALLLVALLGVAIIATSPVTVPVVFGHAFQAMIPMLAVLLVASVAYVPGQILGVALIAAGNPGAAARAQIGGLILTVPALVLLLPVGGAIAAAWVSLASYVVTFVVVLFAARRTFAISPRAMLLADRADIVWLISRGPWARFTSTGNFRHRFGTKSSP